MVPIIRPRQTKRDLTKPDRAKKKPPPFARRDGLKNDSVVVFEAPLGRAKTKTFSLLNPGAFLYRPVNVSPSQTKRLHSGTPMSKLRTAEEARAWLGFQGISIAQWAREHNFNEPLVREVLAGRKRCLRGQCHNIAIALGMKEGTPTDRPGRLSAGERPSAGGKH
jgi:gp16 family phage-associated protein